MLPELDSRRQPEFAMEHSMGRPVAGGGSALAAFLGVCARPAFRAPSRSLSPSSSSSSSSGPPLPLAALFKREAWEEAPRASAGLGGWGGRARARGRDPGVRERRRQRDRGGRPSLWRQRSPVCKEWRGCVCECARVRACVAAGGGVPGVLQHPTAVRAGREPRTTAPRLIPRPPAPGWPPAGPSTPGAGVRRLPGPLRCPRVARCGEGGGTALPALRPARPEGAWSCSASREVLS